MNLHHIFSGRISRWSPSCFRHDALHLYLRQFRYDGADAIHGAVGGRDGHHLLFFLHQHLVERREVLTKENPMKTHDFVKLAKDNQVTSTKLGYLQTEIL